MAAWHEVSLKARKRGFWLVWPTRVMYRVGLRRLALAIAERFVGVDVYSGDGTRYLFSVGLRRKS